MRSMTLGERRDCKVQAKAGKGVPLLCNPRRARLVQLEPCQPALHLQSLSRNCPAPGAPEGGWHFFLSPQVLVFFIVLGPTLCFSDI